MVKRIKDFWQTQDRLPVNCVNVADDTRIQRLRKNWIFPASSNRLVGGNQQIRHPASGRMKYPIGDDESMRAICNNCYAVDRNLQHVSLTNVKDFKLKQAGASAQQ
jgi:hypothetical protein